MSKISVIILTRNVESEIIPAIISTQFADETIIVDTGSTDKTLDMCRKYKLKVIRSTGDSFSKWRNEGAKEAKGDWLLYIDSDERVPVKLAEEIKKEVADPKYQAYTISRYEVFLGKHLNHWGDARVLRLMQKKTLMGWQGKLHEQPKINGTVGDLREQMIHLSHKNIDEKIKSTVVWSELEAEMLLKANHPPMAGWRFIRIMLTEFWLRCIKQGLWRDGTEGWIEIIYQMFSKFVTYERLWELQRSPSLKKSYQQIDEDVILEWKNKNKE